MRPFFDFGGIYLTRLPSVSARCLQGSLFRHNLLTRCGALPFIDEKHGCGQAVRRPSAVPSWMQRLSSGAMRVDFPRALRVLYVLLSFAMSTGERSFDHDIGNLTAALPSICEAYVRAYVGTSIPWMSVEHDILFTVPIHHTSYLCRSGRHDLEKQRGFLQQGNPGSQSITSPLLACDNDGGLLRVLYNSFLSSPLYSSSSSAPPPYASSFQYNHDCRHVSHGQKSKEDGEFMWPDWW